MYERELNPTTSYCTGCRRPANLRLDYFDRKGNGLNIYFSSMICDTCSLMVRETLDNENKIN